MRSSMCTLLAVAVISCLLVSGCSRKPAQKAQLAAAPTDLSSLLNANRGHVLILLLGQEGCPGTAKATEVLDAYVQAKPEQVSVVRLDVPLPDGKMAPLTEWKHAFPRYVDNGRKIAGELEFFYYPTLYVFDGEGAKRYVGGCDKDQLTSMASEILAEKPGAQKKIYTLPMPAVGETAPAFSGSTLLGKQADQNSLKKPNGLLVVFSRTSCPFSKKEIPQFKDLATRYAEKGVGIVVINQQEDQAEVRPVYEKDCAGVPVILDTDGKISKSYGVDAVPFFFLTDKDGKIVARRSFTHPAAVNAINGMLGLKTEEPRYKPAEGG